MRGPPPAHHRPIPNQASTQGKPRPILLATRIMAPRDDKSSSSSSANGANGAAFAQHAAADAALQPPPSNEDDDSAHNDDNEVSLSSVA